MADIVELETITTLDLPHEKVLDGAKGIVTGGCIVLGWDSNDEIYMASSIGNTGEMLLLLEKMKHSLIVSNN